jgi:hypothetical protein
MPSPEKRQQLQVWPPNPMMTTITEHIVWSMNCYESFFFQLLPIAIGGTATIAALV